MSKRNTDSVHFRTAWKSTRLSSNSRNPYRIVALGALLLGAAAAQVKNPGVFSNALIENWSTFDPATCYDVGCSEVVRNTYDTLLFYDGPRADKFVPLLAAALPTVQNGGISQDGKTYTLKLRPGLKFSDGSPLTAQDVEYSIERMMVLSADVGPASLFLEPLLGSGAFVRGGGKVGYAQIDRAVEAPAPDTVVFHLAKPFAPFLSILATPFSAVYSKADAVKRGAWSGGALDWAKFNNPAPGSTVFQTRPPLGSGPFMLERYEPEQLVVLARNANYWRAPAKLSRVILRLVKDETTRLQLLRAGDADAAVVTRPLIATVKRYPGVRVVDDQPAFELDGIFMNQHVKAAGNNYLGSGKLDGNGIPANFFSDIDVRRGFAAAFDDGALIKDVLLGKATRLNTVLVRGLSGYNPNAPKYTFDRAAATREFKRAWGGQVWANGFTLPVFFYSGKTEYQRALNILQRNLAAINPKFKLDVREIQFSQMIAQSAGQQLPLWMLNWFADYADPHNFAFPFLHSAGFFSSSSGFKDAALDALIGRAVAETNLGARAKLYDQIARQGFRDVPNIPVYQPVQAYVQRDWVKGRVFNPMYPNYYYPISK